ncbi:recombinase RecT [Acinetobacter sp. YH12035]|uniref:recombinase RecT n=1 Tax=Acinetobacter sp. YH12035 TaxID=2601045 RepID=UPI00211E1345|nr:recombinase RecT [Acinetobacter sp. YH12035]
MNAQTQIVAAPQSNSVGLLNLEAFELSQRVAKMLSSSTLVPEQYRSVIKVKAGKDQSGQWMYRDEENPNGLSNCIIALNMANRMGADPLMIMQNLYLIEGRPSWSSQFIMASINSCGRFSALRFDLEDLGEKEVEYQETVWSNRQKQTVTKKIKIQNFACTAWAIERETGERLNSSKITIEMAVKEGWYQKNGSKWQTMPEQMLRYRAASFFGRVYAPELLMGLKSAEEEQDQIIDVTPDQELVVKADTAQLKREILAVKSPAELNALEEKVFDIADDSARKELMKLVNAQSQKFQPKVVEEVSAAEEKPAVNEKKSKEVKAHYLATFKCASAVKGIEHALKKALLDPELTDAHKKELELGAQKEITAIEKHLADSAMAKEQAENDGVSVDELKRLQQEAEALVQQKKQPSSAEMKKEYAKALNTAKSLADVLDIEEQIENDNALTQADFQYLQANIEQVRGKFEASQAPAVDPLKSGSVKNGLILLISDAKNGEDLRQVAQQMNAAKPNLTSEHQQELLQAYQQKKKLIEDQMDMFPGN